MKKLVVKNECMATPSLESLKAYMVHKRHTIDLMELAILYVEDGAPVSAMRELEKAKEAIQVMHHRRAELGLSP